MWASFGSILPTTQGHKVSIDREEANGLSETDARNKMYKIVFDILISIQ